MLNRITVQGRLTRDPEVNATTNQTVYCRFQIASERNFGGQDGQKQTDFLPCVAWKQKAQFLGQYFHKGDMILISGTLQSRQYDDSQGQKKTSYEILVDEIDFCGGRREEERQESRQSVSLSDMPKQDSVPSAPAFEETDNGELPFEV